MMAVSGGEQVGYRAYTTDFDRVVTANQLESVLGPLSPRSRSEIDAAWDEFQGALTRWKTRLHLQALDAAEAVRRSTTDQEREGTVVALLIDHSGSMRGQAILLAAAAADIAQNFLRHLGCKVEVLGFTTVSWRGGRARRRWLWRLRPRQPGRLCELLHIIYRSADDERASTDGWDFRAMLRPDLPKENVDGEALQWAAGRLRARSEPRKLLVMISDGAPVDDATLMANGAHYLENHLRSVIHAIDAAGDIELGAIGIGFEVDRYYASTAIIRTAEDLGGALIDYLAGAISHPASLAESCAR